MAATNNRPYQAYVESHCSNSDSEESRFIPTPSETAASEGTITGNSAFQRSGTMPAPSETTASGNTIHGDLDKGKNDPTSPQFSTFTFGEPVTGETPAGASIFGGLKSQVPGFNMPTFHAINSNATNISNQPNHPRTTFATKGNLFGSGRVYGQTSECFPNSKPSSFSTFTKSPTNSSFFGDSRSQMHGFNMPTSNAGNFSTTNFETSSDHPRKTFATTGNFFGTDNSIDAMERAFKGFYQSSNCSQIPDINKSDWLSHTGGSSFVGSNTQGFNGGEPPIQITPVQIPSVEIPGAFTLEGHIPPTTIYPIPPLNNPGVSRFFGDIPFGQPVNGRPVNIPTINVLPTTNPPTQAQCQCQCSCHTQTRTKVSTEQLTQGNGVFTDSFMTARDTNNGGLNCRIAININGVDVISFLSEVLRLLVGMGIPKPTPNGVTVAESELRMPGAFPMDD